MLTNEILLILGPLGMVIGIVAGIAIYRMLWLVDTASMREELHELTQYNRALQRQVVEMEKKLSEVGERMRTLEEVNNELMQQVRRRIGE